MDGKSYDEDVSFIKNFIMASGSKRNSKSIQCDIPHCQAQLDKLIQKIKISESTASEPYIAFNKTSGS